MFRTLLIIVWLFCSPLSAQIFKPKEVQKINLNFKQTFIKKQNFASYKVSNFKFTLKANLNGGAIQKAMQSHDNFNFVGYDFRTKYYLTKRIHVILKTNFNGNSAFASFGISYILEK